MASVQKKKNSKGSYQYTVSYDLPRYIDGKRRKTTKTFPVGTPLSEVKKFVAEKELELQRSSFVSTNINITFDELGELYFSTYTNFLSPTTLKNYRSAYYNSKPHGLKNYFGKAKVKSIKSRDIQDYINFLDKNLSPKSIKNYWGLLRIIFNIAVRERIIQREENPMLCEIDKPKQAKKSVKAYNYEELEQFFKLVNKDYNPDIKLILHLALLSGIRRGEMAALKWTDVNFDERYIDINKSRAIVDGEDIIKPPKTQAGIRKIYLPDSLLDILREYHQRYIENKIKYGKEFSDKGYVVSKPNGEPFTPQGISNNYLRFKERHKDEFNFLRFHDLRHTYASLLIEQGENPKTVQHNLGHSNVSFTLQIYSHSYEDTQKRAAEHLESAIKSLTTSQVI